MTEFHIQKVHNDQASGSVNPAADPAWVAARDVAGQMTSAEAGAYYGALESQKGHPEMIEFQGNKYMLGEMVTVEVTGIVDGLSDSGSLRIRYRGLNGERHILVSESLSVQTERRIPAQGTPKAGEIWRDAEDRQWFAFANGMRRADKDTGMQAVSFVNEQYGPLVRVYPEGGK